jgi:hypothetical protein
MEVIAMGLRSHDAVETCPFCGHADQDSPEELLYKVEVLLIDNNSANMSKAKAELIKALVYEDYQMFDIMLNAFQEVRATEGTKNQGVIP